MQKFCLLYLCRDIIKLEQPPVPMFSAFCYFRKNAEVGVFGDFLESQPYFNKSCLSNPIQSISVKLLGMCGDLGLHQHVFAPHVCISIDDTAKKDIFAISRCIKRFRHVIYLSEFQIQKN